VLNHADQAQGEHSQKQTAVADTIDHYVPLKVIGDLFSERNPPPV
jgi:hypothetical protein